MNRTRVRDNEVIASRLPFIRLRGFAPRAARSLPLAVYPHTTFSLDVATATPLG